MRTRRFCLPFFSIPVDRHGTDLAGAPHMSAAAGLQVEACDLDQAHLAGAPSAASPTWS